ncbi:MAG: GyrI-like domain-containing protein [Spirochaetales bacterium]|nr:GyrI-like domain-containing protein [Spirochaetales bacterium]
MKPLVVEKDKLYLAGYSFYGDPFSASGAWTEENEIGKLWKRFMGFFAERAEEIPPSAVPGIGYEVHVWSKDVMETGQYEVFVGMAINEIADVPVDLSIKALPKAKFAVFTLSGDLIEKDLSSDMRVWLEAEGQHQTGNFIYNRYDDRYKGMENLKDSEIEVYVPIT